MRRAHRVGAVFVVSLLAGSGLGAHPGHLGHHARSSSSAAELAQARPHIPGAVSGQGAMRFRVLYASERLPAPARAALPAAHGGFAVDRRPGRGEIYFALPEAGLVRISADLETIEMVATNASMRDVNLHNTTMWQAADETPYLTFPANDAGLVFTTTLTGELVHTLAAPEANVDLGHETVNAYFAAGQPFTPTDVDHLNGLLYLTTGYSELDWVLTARVRDTTPLTLGWNPLAFGGRGTEPGRLGTGHGVTVVRGSSPTLEIADRPHAEVDRFTPDGRYLSTLELPPGSFPCDIDYHDGYAVVGALYGPDRSKGAPIYVLRGDRVVSQVWPKEELGLQGFQHIHNAVLTRAGERFYIVAQAWNPGDFAVLEQVTD